MARPTNKKELLELAEINFNKLFDFIDGLPDNIKNGTYKPVPNVSYQERYVLDMLKYIEYNK